MNYTAEIRNNDTPVLAGNFRVAAGLILMLFGLLFGVFSDLPGHGFGLLAFLIFPFIVLTDKKKMR